MNIDFDKIKNIHLIAICGTAMGALAGMLKEKGFNITGSDQGIYPPMSTYLLERGIKVMEGFKPENLDVNPDLAIVGNTVKRDNPEAQELIRRNIPYIHLPTAISEIFLKPKHPIVIAGTHGKTTTTGLCAWVFYSAGKDPGFLVGGVLKNFNSNARLGQGEHFIIEGDEYDSAYFDKVPKIWHYRPKTAVITSVEFDHGDIYKDIDHIKTAFSHFVSLIPSGGSLLACADYPHIYDIIPHARCPVTTYGYAPSSRLRVEDVVLDEKGSLFTLVMDGIEVYRFRLPLWGRHNASNGAVVAQIALQHGISIEEIQKGFDTFEGIKRRQEIIYDEDDILIIDDFAHHPTKVRETVKAVRSRFPERRLISVYEPRTNTSRRNFFQDTYPHSFIGSDHVIIAGVFNSGQIEPEKLMNPQKLVEDINKLGISAEFLPNADSIVDGLSSFCRRGDLVLIMSNGGFGGIYTKLPQRFRSRRAEVGSRS